MRLAFLAGAMLLGCGADSTPAGPPDSGITETERDGAADAGMDVAQTLNAAPSLVFVDALVAGLATSTAQQPFQLDDVRVCVHLQSAAPNVFLTDHAQPFDRVIPLTNYVGLQKGSGIDLGPTSTSSAIDIDVYPAVQLQNDAAWAPDSNATCAKISCAQTGAPCVPHVRVSVVPTGTVQVVALVDDLADGGVGVKTRNASFVDKAFDGQNNQIYGTVVDLSDWHTGATIGAFYGDWQTPDAGTAIVASLAKDSAAQPGPIATAIPSYDTFGLRFDATINQESDSFGQSLDSIAYVADPTVTPPSFYDVRENFVFALVGDPNDATDVNLLGGRNPKFARTGLHIAAVPYATPRPAK